MFSEYDLFILIFSYFFFQNAKCYFFNQFRNTDGGNPLHNITQPCYLALKTYTQQFGVQHKPRSTFLPLLLLLEH